MASGPVLAPLGYSLRDVSGNWYGGWWCVPCVLAVYCEHGNPVPDAFGETQPWHLDMETGEELACDRCKAVVYVESS